MESVMATFETECIKIQLKRRHKIHRKLKVIKSTEQKLFVCARLNVSVLVMARTCNGRRVVPRLGSRHAEDALS